MVCMLGQMCMFIDEDGHSGVNCCTQQFGGPWVSGDVWKEGRCEVSGCKYFGCPFVVPLRSMHVVQLVCYICC
jgi:hypothetical protein